MEERELRDGGCFGAWSFDEDGKPVFVVEPARIDNADGGSLVLPEGGIGSIWHLLGAETVIATAHLCGNLSLYFVPRTITRLTGEPGSQSRVLKVGEERIPLEVPERVAFGQSYCEWRYRVNPTSRGSGRGEITLLRRVAVVGAGRLCLSVEVSAGREGTPDPGIEAYYEESWRFRPLPLIPLPLMGSGPVPRSDCDSKAHQISRYLAYGISGATRRLGEVARSLAGLGARFEVRNGRDSVTLWPSASKGWALVQDGLGRPPVDSPGNDQVGAAGAQRPAAVDATLPVVGFSVREVSGEEGPGGMDVSGRSLRGGAEVDLRWPACKGGRLVLEIAVTDAEGAGAAPSPPAHEKPTTTRADSSPSKRNLGASAGAGALPVTGDERLDRELAWHLGYLRQLAVRDAYFGRRFVTQGSAYTFLQGAHGAPRDYAISAAALAEADPELARSTIEVMMMMTRTSGSMFYMHAGRGWCSDVVVHQRPSDLPIFLLWALCEYVEASGDESFLDERVPFYPLHEGYGSTVAERISLAFRWLADRLGTGPHGMLRVGSGDWADPISMMVDDAHAFHRSGESGLNTAFACHVLPRAASLLRSRDPETAAEMEEFAEALASAMQQAWTGSWYLRGWDGKGRPLGDAHLFLDVQAFCLVAGLGEADRRASLVEEVSRRCMDPSPIGAVILDRPHPTRFGLLPAGWDCNGGVWAAINAFLAWGLSLHDGELALECLYKQTLAAHADAYPRVWYGIWSGPDCYNAHYAERPGETFNLPATPMAEYPVMNSNAHAGPLLAARKVFGRTG